MAAQTQEELLAAHLEQHKIDNEEPLVEDNDDDEEDGDDEDDVEGQIDAGGRSKQSRSEKKKSKSYAKDWDEAHSWSQPCYCKKEQES
ncbi:hypothetical protein L1987_59870 [Smallanthus sonchifolius]|uniref:Uncharacterized protein n=1 Tax=Smallanthus sonchifolius TaxID=185202 RepID=A0ACB9D6X0_9ASTR|nr:hypothetical protein L1987_59870 [Smallanthus sonchifolius]